MDNGKERKSVKSVNITMRFFIEGGVGEWVNSKKEYGN